MQFAKTLTAITICVCFSSGTTVTITDEGMEKYRARRVRCREDAEVRAELWLTGLKALDDLASGRRA